MLIERSEQALSLGLEATHLAQTRGLQECMLKALAALNSNGIMAIDGVPGVGKTTCARLVSQAGRRPFAMVRMTDTPRPTELLRRGLKAITGTPTAPADERFHLQERFLRVLDGWGGVLIVDELQNSLANVMQELTWLYEESDHGFGLIVVGTGVINALNRYPQLQTRLLTDHTFMPLRDTDLVTAVRDIDDRFCDASDAVLKEHDEAKCAGLLRRWGQTVTWMNELGITETVDAAILRDVRSMMSTQRAPSNSEVQGRKGGRGRGRGRGRAA